MSLYDLEPFIDEQNEAIVAASSGFTPCNDPSWGAFRDRFWGGGEESFQEMKPVERDEVQPVADVQLPSHHLVAMVPSVARNLFNIESNELLVRSEYRAAEQAAVLSCRTDTKVFVISGTPGIGLLSPFFGIHRI